ncbi:DMT family protein, partial [Chitinophaga sp. GbtcB8]|uniref:DMT family protein n=1 Tax=Chitinophaga sp. GbtcB8 TaxID=2824753 RepID=UPI001C2F7022
LIVSNTCMTFAWYGHLKHQDKALWKVILICWGIAFFEYCFMVPANRLGSQEGFSGFQLKTIQEIVTLSVFCLFAVFYLKEPLRWNYLVSFVFILAAVYFMFKK